MNEGVLTAISVFAAICAVVFGYAAFARSKRVDTTDAATKNATMITDLGYIKACVDDIKTEQRDRRKEDTKILVKLTDAEAEIKQLIKRIEKLEQNGRG